MFGVCVFLTVLCVVVAILGIVIAFGNNQWANPFHMWLTIGATAGGVIFSTIIRIMS